MIHLNYPKKANNAIVAAITTNSATSEYAMNCMLLYASSSRFFTVNSIGLCNSGFGSNDKFCH